MTTSDQIEQLEIAMDQARANELAEFNANRKRSSLRQTLILCVSGVSTLILIIAIILDKENSLNFLKVALPWGVLNSFLSILINSRYTEIKRVKLNSEQMFEQYIELVNRRLMEIEPYNNLI